MKLFLNHALMIATFVVAKVSAEDRIENSYMRPRSLAHYQKAREDKPAKIIPYKSAYSKRPATCDRLVNGLKYVGEHAKVETEFSGDDKAAIAELKDLLREKLHKELDNEEAEKVFNNIDDNEILTSMFPQIKEPVVDEKGRRLNEEDTLHESWDSEEEFDQYMAHAEYYIETFPFDEVHQIIAEMEELDKPAIHPNMTVEDIQVHYSGKGLSTLNHRRLQDDEDLGAFVEARGHRVLDACINSMIALFVDTIALILAVIGIGSLARFG
jgi:hypothetical protein